MLSSVTPGEREGGLGDLQPIHGVPILSLGLKKPETCFSLFSYIHSVALRRVCLRLPASPGGEREVYGAGPLPMGLPYISLPPAGCTGMTLLGAAEPPAAPPTPGHQADPEAHKE